MHTHSQRLSKNAYPNSINPRKRKFTEDTTMPFNLLLLCTLCASAVSPDLLPTSATGTPLQPCSLDDNIEIDGQTFLHTPGHNTPIDMALPKSWCDAKAKDPNSSLTSVLADAEKKMAESGLRAGTNFLHVFSFAMHCFEICSLMCSIAWLFCSSMHSTASKFLHLRAQLLGCFFLPCTQLLRNLFTYVLNCLVVFFFHALNGFEICSLMCSIVLTFVTNFPSCVARYQHSLFHHGGTGTRQCLQPRFICIITRGCEGGQAVEYLFDLWPLWGRRD